VAPTAGQERFPPCAPLADDVAPRGATNAVRRGAENGRCRPAGTMVRHAMGGCFCPPCPVSSTLASSGNQTDAVGQRPIQSADKVSRGRPVERGRSRGQGPCRLPAAAASNSRRSSRQQPPQERASSSQQRQPAGRHAGRWAAALHLTHFGDTDTLKRTPPCGEWWGCQWREAAVEGMATFSAAVTGQVRSNVCLEPATVDIFSL
jgi:hypothetical protein